MQILLVVELIEKGDLRQNLLRMQSKSVIGYNIDTVILFERLFLAAQRR